MTGLIVVDTNVIVASRVEGHVHHASSLALFTANPPLNIAVPAHCYAEAFTTLTRRGPRAPFQWPAEEAWPALESMANVSQLIGLSPAQGFAAVREYAAMGNIGARIYDYLIAKTALSAGANVLVTWNVGHFEGLVKGLEVQTPTGFLQRG